MQKSIFHRISSFTNKVLHLSIFREGSLYTLSNLISQIMAFVSIIFVSRYLGPVNLGIMNFVQNYCGIFFSFLGSADYYFSWHIDKAEDKVAFVKEYVMHRFYMSIFIILTASFIAFNVFPPDVFFYSIIMILAFVFTAFSPLYLYSLYEKRAKLIFWIQFYTALTFFVSKIIFVILEMPLMYFIILSAIDITISSMIYFIYYFYNYKTWRRSLIKFKFFNPIRTFNFYFDIRYAILVPCMWMLLMKIDQMILGLLYSQNSFLQLKGGAYNLGIYSAAVKLAEIPNIFAGILYVLLISRLGKILDRGDNNKIQKIFTFYILAGLTFSGLIFILSPYIINLVYGEQFYESIDILRIYGLSIISVYVITFYAALLGAKYNYKRQVVIFLIGLCLNIFFVVLFTATCGLIGAAWATVASYGVVAFLLYFCNKFN